jgi:hypothetical protein
MKFSVDFENKNIEIESESPIMVSDLIKYLKNYFQIDQKKVLKLTNQCNYITDNTILKEDNLNNNNLFLVALDSHKEGGDDKKVLNLNAVDIVQLIAEMTNATKKMEIVNPKKNLLEQGVSGGIDSLFSLLNNEELMNAPPELRDQLLRLIRGTQNSSSESNSQMESSQSVSMSQVEPQQELINMLLEMGFQEDRCRKVLIHTNNEINAAMEMLLSDQDLYLP